MLEFPMEMTVARQWTCQQCKTRPIYYPTVHHLDGNRNNNSPGNVVLVCPECGTHFTFRFNDEDIWNLKKRGLNNAKIGRTVGLSRERVRQILNRRARFEVIEREANQALNETKGKRGAKRRSRKR